MTQGKYALVDKADFKLLSRWNDWYAVKSGNTFYAVRQEKQKWSMALCLHASSTCWDCGKRFRRLKSGKVSCSCGQHKKVCPCGRPHSGEGDLCPECQVNN